MLERLSHKTKWILRKFRNDEDFKANKPYEESIIDGNILLNEGITELQNLLTGGGGTPFDNTNAYIGVGDSSTAEAVTQTGLQATNNKLYKAMDAGYPQINGQTTIWRATFGSADANFAWNEFTVANGNSDTAVNLNRKVSAQGTKSSGSTWTLEVQITWS